MMEWIKKIVWPLALVMGVFCMAKAENPEEKKGDVIITVFSDFYSGFGRVNGERGFDLDRAYIGYEYRASSELEIKAVMDFGQSRQVDDYHRIGFIKNAQVTWQRNGWELNGGLISTTQFKTQEDFWGKRYVMKSFQDEYKFGSSADLGISAAYTVNDWWLLDVIVANGEGYKNLQTGKGLQYGAGMTFRPVESVVLRLYGSYNEASEKALKGVTNLAFFAGYQNRWLSVGGEYNHQLNTDFIDGQDASGVSLYATFRTGDKVSLFGRWDRLDSRNAWNKAQDGMNALVGAEFRLGKYVKLAPNVRVTLPEEESLGKECYFYLNAAFVL